MDIKESAAMEEIREIRRKLTEQMKGMTDDEIVAFIRSKSLAVEKQYNLRLPCLDKSIK